MRNILYIVPRTGQYEVFQILIRLYIVQEDMGYCHYHQKGLMRVPPQLRRGAATSPWRGVSAARPWGDPPHPALTKAARLLLHTLTS